MESSTGPVLRRNDSTRLPRKLDSIRSAGDSLIVRKIALALALSAVLAGATSAVAQARWVRLDGAVQWIAANTMMLVADGGSSVNIDLTKVPLDQYRGVGPGDRVTVVGLVSPDNRKVYGTSITLSGYQGFQAP